MEYRVVIHQEDGSYWGEVPELPGCFASCATLDELKDAAAEAIALYRETDASSSPRWPGGASVGEMRVLVPER